MTTNPKKAERTHTDDIEMSLLGVLGAIGPGSALREPDYDAMWQRMETAMASDAQTPLARTGRSGSVRPSSRVRLRKIALATTLSAALAAVPAYAAIQYDWSGLLHGRESIQEALKQGLGQEINRSVTHDGVTLTLHTAVIDEGRTLILYSLESDKRSVQDADFSRISLQDANGEVFEAYATRTPDFAGRADSPVTGYFETDWSPGSSSASQAITFSADGLTFRETAERPASFDASSPDPSRIEIGEAGIDSVELRAFDQNDGRMMIRTSVLPEKNGQNATNSVSVAAFGRDGQAILPAPGAIHGTPSADGGYTNQDYFSATDLLQSGVTYKVMYQRTTDRIESSWAFPLVLDGSKMAHASARHKLDLNFGSGDSAMTVRKLTITPTQIRVDLNRGKLQASPFNEYRLIVDGKEVSNPLGWFDGDDPQDAVLTMDRPADLKLSPDSVIELRAKHEVLKHDGDLPAPLLLRQIGEQKQELSSEVGGYPVTWTYYKQNGDLVIRANSENPNFGGIGQTYRAEGSKRLLADERNARIWGDASNTLTEIYKNYSADSAEMHIFYYMEHRPDQQEQIKLYPSE